ncbi:hypothetical protein HCN44_003974 [Aphidius gifuensis]|uniref:RHD domain-containing protein n=1 Tax=Aphidius gifuensis TaxID=684658 RepID=A0A835CSN4_APHGI|nr:embryonic polarity protein dorsal-like [Aphidius gifuensis]KAF7994502.1 hypothetical protein HCN44_003974 [Aphidius gifuensis]
MQFQFEKNLQNSEGDFDDDSDDTASESGEGRLTIDTSINDEPIKTSPIQNKILSSVIEVIEQPVRTLTFKYQCEGPMKSNTHKLEKKFISLRIHGGYEGPALLFASCVTKNQDDYKKFRPHPHKIIGKNCNSQGIYVLPVVLKNDNVINIPQLNILCIKKIDYAKTLQERAKINVDPFQAGFDYKNETNTIDPSAIRLCFQIFHYNKVDGKVCLQKLSNPIVTNPIYNNDLKICKLSPDNGPACGGTDVILLCEKIQKNDIKIRFFVKDSNNKIIWESFGGFNPVIDIHKQYAIFFKTPAYKNQTIYETVEVFVELIRPSNGDVSNTCSFKYIPDEDTDIYEDVGSYMSNQNFNNRDQMKANSSGSSSTSSTGSSSSSRLIIAPRRRLSSATWSAPSPSSDTSGPAQYDGYNQPVSSFQNVNQNYNYYQL